MEINLTVHNNVAVWHGESPRAAMDIWFLPGFGDSHLCFRHAFTQSLVEHARIYVFDPPGHGASPAQPQGLDVAECAQLWQELIEVFSAGRPVALLGHSMSSIIATQTAMRLSKPPALLVSVEGNLTKDDATYTGIATRYESAEDFHAAFTGQILEQSNHDIDLRRYYTNLLFSDPKTLWRLGRSVQEYPNPGDDFANLDCPKVHYWDPQTTSAASQQFIHERQLPHRQMNGLGHWPMVQSPAKFYQALEFDLLALAMA